MPMLNHFYKYLIKNRYFKEIFENLFAPLLIGLLLGFDKNQLLLLIFGCFLIDIDHLFYFFYKKRINFKEIAAFAKQEFNNHHPHFYLFHSYELVLIAMFVSYHYSSWLFYLFFGFLINLILDTWTYILFYKKPEPWLKFLSVSYLIWIKK